MGAHRLRRAARLTALALATAGCGAARPAAPTAPRLPASLVAGERPIGRAPAFHPPAAGPVLGPCRRRLGARDAAHVEVFAADRVVLVAAGIGTRPPRRRDGGRIVAAGCYGDLVTLDPTGVVLVRPGAQRTVGDLFRSWGQPLSARRLLSFTARRGATVRAFVDGRRWTAGSPRAIPLSRHAEIVLEVGPPVPPHRTYTFPPGR